MVRTIIHGAMMGGGVQMGFSIPVSNFHLIAGGGAQSGQWLLVLPPRCDIFLVRTLNCLGYPKLLPSFKGFPYLLLLVTVNHISFIPQ